MGVTPRLRSTYLLVAATAAAAALVTAVGGGVLERRRFGADDRETVARIRRARAAVQSQRRGARCGRLGPVRWRDLIRARRAGRRPALFDALGGGAGRPSATGITVYNTAGEPLAWTDASRTCRPSAQGQPRSSSRPTRWAASRARQPMADVAGRPTPRFGSCRRAATGADRVTPGAADTFMMRSSIAPVSVRAAIGGARRRSDYAFVSRQRRRVLVEAE